MRERLWCYLTWLGELLTMKRLATSLGESICSLLVSGIDEEQLWFGRLSQPNGFIILENGYYSREERARSRIQGKSNDDCRGFGGEL